MTVYVIRNRDGSVEGVYSNPQPTGHREARDPKGGVIWVPTGYRCETDESGEPVQYSEDDPEVRAITDPPPPAASADASVAIDQLVRLHAAGIIPDSALTEELREAIDKAGRPAIRNR